MAEQKQNPVVIAVLVVIIIGAILFNLKRMGGGRSSGGTARTPAGLPSQLTPPSAAGPGETVSPRPAGPGGVVPQGASPVSPKVTVSGKKITAPAIKSEIKRLTSGLSYDTQPAFSPNGREIAYASYNQGRQNIYILTLNSNEKPVPLTKGDCLDSHPSWTADGKKIVFSSNRQGKNELYAVDKFTGDITPFNKDGTSPAIGPDGEWLAFVDQYNIWIMKLTSKEFTPLTRSGYNDWPSWGKEGKDIYFSGGGLIKVYNLESGEVKDVTSRGFSDYPSVSPCDGRLVYVSLDSGAYDLWIMDRDGSKKSQLTGDEAREYFPSWSPDGRSIVFASDASGLSQLWLLTLPAQ